MKKTFGQIAFEATTAARTDHAGLHRPWELAAQIVRDSFEAAATAVIASQWRPVTDPPQYESMRVLLRGKEINTFMRPFCERVLISSLITHWAAIPSFAEPTDPYADLKAAHAAGKVIQRKHTIYDQWVDLDKDRVKLYFEDEYSRDELRIKPWTLSRHLPGFRALEPGEEWHRSDFTEEMLPEGWRPLLMGEALVPNDEGDYGADGVPMFCIFNGGNTKTFPQYRYRTRRPLPSTRAELERREFEEWAKSESFSVN